MKCDDFYEKTVIKYYVYRQHDGRPEQGHKGDRIRREQPADVGDVQHAPRGAAH